MPCPWPQKVDMRPAFFAEQFAPVRADRRDMFAVVWFRSGDYERRPVCASGDKPIFFQLGIRIADVLWLVWNRCARTMVCGIFPSGYSPVRIPSRRNTAICMHAGRGHAGSPPIFCMSVRAAYMGSAAGSLFLRRPCASRALCRLSTRSRRRPPKHAYPAAVRCVELRQPMPLQLTGETSKSRGAHKLTARPGRSSSQLHSPASQLTPYLACIG